MRRTFIAASVVTLLMSAGLVPALGQDRTPAPAASPVTTPAEPKLSPDPAASGSYVIGPEDVLQITVWRNDSMSRVVQVRPDGFVSLPLLNDVKAAGITPMALRQVLIQRLTEFMASPDVSVIVTDVRSFKVTVIGEVMRPGRYELKSATTALDLLAAAGGFNQFAARSRVVVLRPNGGKMQRIPFNYNRVTSTGGETENMVLQPGDILLVP